MGRPVSWPDKIIGAPEEAMEFYRLVAKLQKTEAFVDCHIFTGAKIDDLPHIAFKTTTTNLPRMICGFLGYPYRKRLCGSPGCMNPFHYANVALQAAFAAPELIETPVISTSLEDYREAIRHVVEEYELPTPPTFEDIRKYVPQEDVDDSKLMEILKSWK